MTSGKWREVISFQLMRLKFVVIWQGSVAKMNRNLFSTFDLVATQANPFGSVPFVAEHRPAD